MKKIILCFLTLTIAYFLINKYYIKNSWCKMEDGRYEVWGSTPIDITKNIKNGQCECISESLIIENNPNIFSKNQLFRIKNELPNWAMKNIKNFSQKDKIILALELNKLSEDEFSKKLIYKYSFIANLVGCPVPVYTYNIKSNNAYCPNYKCVNDAYDNPSLSADGFKLFPKKEKPYYSNIESESWAKNFGNEGI